MVFWISKRFDNSENIPAVSKDLLSIAWKSMKTADHLSNNLRLNEIFVLIFFQLQIVIETIYGLNPY